MNRRDTNALPDELVEAARNPVDPLSISVRVPDPNTDFGERLIVAARQVEEGTWGAIPVSVEGVPELPDGPVLTIRVGDRAAISYQAVPAGPEAAPFLDALKTLATGGAGTVPELDQPSEIVVFISPDCHNCPHTVRAATQLAAVNRGVTTTVVDISEFADRAAVVGIRSVPMAVVNDGLTLVGAMSAQDLADKIAAEGGPDDEGRVFASLVEAGRFDAAGALLIDGNAREAYLELWRASALEHRIGLVLTAGEVLEADPQALDDMVPGLVSVLATEDAARRGDTADLLGQIGHPSARAGLEGLLTDPVEDVAEIASEALESLRAEEESE